MSMLIENTTPIPPDKQSERFCKVPTFVSDKRYPPRSIKYLYILHNHTAVPTSISREDIGAVVKLARIHGGFVETKDGRIPVGVIAYFSNSYEPSPSSCDGFYEYTWESSAILKWTHDEQGQWRQQQTGTVTWHNDTEFSVHPE
jgi:hypothetical protein